MRTALASTLIVAAGLAAAGCGARDPLESKVTAESPVGLQMWMADASGRLSQEQAANLQEAIQELRFRIMAEGRASGSGPIEAALCGEIDGKSVREVVIAGFNCEAARLQGELAELHNSTRENARLRVREGDTASADYLDRVRTKVAKRLEDAVDAQARAKRILAEYTPQFD